MSLLASEFTPEEVVAGLTGIIFDCDGVILDSFGSNRHFYNLIRTHFGLPLMTPAQEAFVHAHPVTTSVAHVVPPGCLEEAMAISKALDYREVLPHVQLYDGVLELLRTLRDLGFRLAMNTNRTSTIDLVFEHFGLGGLFDPVVTANLVAKPKPHPESVLRILSQWGSAPERVAYIGDSSLDEQAATGARVRFWSYRNEALSARLHVDDFHALRRRIMASYGASQERPDACGTRP